MKRILLTLMVTIAGSMSANAVVAGPSVGVIIGIPQIVIGAPVYRPAPVYYAPAPIYYAPAPVYSAPPVVVRAAPRYYAPVIVAPSNYGGHGYYGGYRGYGHKHYNRGYYSR